MTGNGFRVTAGAMALVMGLSVSGCLNGQGFSRMSKEDKIATGTVAGMVAGGLIGYTMFGSGDGRWIAAAIIGALGAAGGYEVTQKLTAGDQQAMDKTAYHSLTEAPSGNGMKWSNMESGNSGDITPLRTYLSDDGRICREFKATVKVDGVEKETVQKACRNENGDWIVG